MAGDSPLGEHGTWFHLLPGLKNLEAAVSHKLGHTAMGDEIHGIPHVIMAVFVILLLFVAAFRYRGQLAAAGDGGVVPERRLNARSFIEIISEAALGMMSGVMGRDAAKYFLPLIGSLALFILTSNLLGLVPGFLPATDSLNTTLALGTVVFIVTHIYGAKKHGAGHYFAHFLGPVWWLAWLMLPIELISHLARPLSLALRLMGNMFGDHTVLAIFLGLVPFVVPIPVMILGVLVCIVQTLVFCLLSVVYIGLAIEQAEEAHH
jgi:F-type H+-transporting ATPase subunit a